MIRERQFSLWQLLVATTQIAACLGLIRYLLISGQGERILWWSGVALTVFVGSIMAAVGCWSLFHAIRQTFFWPKASASIVRYCVKRSEDRPNAQTFYHPVLRFEASGRGPITTISHWGLSWRPWKTGTTVEVHYNPAQPQWAEIASFAIVWGTPLTFLGLTIAMAVLSLWFAA